MDIQTYAFILLLIRIASMTFIGLVIWRQYTLFRIKLTSDINHYRVVLFILAIAVFLGNIIPAGIDILTITGDISRSVQTVKPVSLLYSMDSAMTALISSFLIWRLYRMSAQSDRDHVESEHMITNDEVHETIK
jgi:hypothetical protein